MGLSIKNTEVEDMLRTLAARHGQTMTETLRLLLKDALADDSSRRRGQRHARNAELARIAALGSSFTHLSEASDDDLIGYDENGLPR